MAQGKGTCAGLSPVSMPGECSAGTAAALRGPEAPHGHPHSQPATGGSKHWLSIFLSGGRMSAQASLAAIKGCWDCLHSGALGRMHFWVWLPEAPDLVLASSPCQGR